MGVATSDCFLPTLCRYTANVLKKKYRCSHEHVESISYEVS